MRLITFLLFSLFSFNSFAQSITGIWRGKFEQNNLDYGSSRFNTETYKYEVQLNNLNTNGIEGVTYSYLTTVFYGKAALKGVYKPSAKTLTLKETVMLDLKASGRTEPCLMTCYLDYKKIGKLEILSGTYSSVNAKTKNDCGSGTVYLEKVEESDFEKESFLMKKKAEPKNTENKKDNIKKRESNVIKKKDNTDKVFAKPKTAEPKETNKTVAKNKAQTKKDNTSITKKIIKPSITKPGAENYIIKKNKQKEIKDSATTAKKNNDTSIERPDVNKPKIEESPKVKVIPDPEAEALIGRTNKLINTIVVDSKEVILAFYDNGLIDNDTISVFKDNQLVIDKKRLSTTPLVLTLNFDDINNFYEITTVAENLGDEPPNTALMVLNYGNKRKEVSLSSDMNTNAKIIIKYQP